MSSTSWTMIVRGSGMHMDWLSVDSGDVLITGRIDSISYEDEAPVKEGFFKRLLG
ncbi:MAG: YabP/YqfC family sporulation protein [Oscillospiraceae bacterium]|nr:YabP/YqfC family sporulation protein [Oscillospiraceae bacterium]